MSPTTEMYLALLHSSLITPSGHTICSPTTAKDGLSSMNFFLSAFKREAMADTSTPRLTTLLRFLAGGLGLPGCIMSSLPPSIKAEGSHTAQHKDCWWSCCCCCCPILPPTDLISNDLKQFSLLVEKDFMSSSLSLATSVVNNR